MCDCAVAGAQLMNDLHMYDIASGSWTDLTAPLDITRPLEREHMGFAEWSGKLYVFGGYSGKGSHSAPNFLFLHHRNVFLACWLLLLP